MTLFFPLWKIFCYLRKILEYYLVPEKTRTDFHIYEYYI